MIERTYRGRIAITSELPHEKGRDSGSETWEITYHADGLRTLRARCLLTDDPPVFRDVIQSIDDQFHPRDAFARIVVQALTTADGRVSQHFPITRAMRGFGTHALQSDAWLVARYDYSQGPGIQRFRGNLMTTINHRGAGGPIFMTTNSSLEYVGLKTITVPAGTFECHCLRFVETSHDYPPYEMFVTADEHFFFVHARLEGPTAQRFDLMELTPPEEN
jgi:hypothetical protein